MKEFNVNEHLACPACGFETVFIDPATRTIALVLKNGKPDLETVEPDLDAKWSDVCGVYCNSRYCSVKINA